MKPTTQSTLDAPYNASPNAPQVEPNRVGGHRSVEEVAQLRVASGVTGQELMAFREGMVQRRGRAGAPSDPKEVTSIAAQGLSGTSQALPYRERLESGFGVDLSGVRVHTGVAAVQASRAIGAEAYTMGNNIALAQPNPSQELMAHEVAHVIQQRAGSGPASGVGQVGDRFEQEADIAAAQIASGGSSNLAHRYGAGSVQDAVQCIAVQRYESSEHAQTADGMQYPFNINPIELPNGAMATRGELVAFGDFYQSYDMIAQAPRQETECLIGLIRWEGIWRLAGRQARHTGIGSTASPTEDPTTSELDAARHNTSDGGDHHMLDTAVEHADLAWTDPAWEVEIAGTSLRTKALDIHAQFTPCWEFMGIAMPVERLSEVGLIMAHLRSTLGRRRFRNTNNTLGSNEAGEFADTTSPDISDPAGHGGDYFDLASNNLSHFAVTNWATWKAYHKQCCDLVAGKPGDAEVKQRAVIEDMWGCHFLTDMFASGHMLDKQELMTFATDMMVNMSQAQGLSNPGDNRAEVVEEMLVEALQICFRDDEVYDGWRQGCEAAFEQNLIRYDEMELMLTIPRGNEWATGTTVVGNLVNTLMGMPWRNNQSSTLPGGGENEAFGPGNQEAGMGDYQLGVGNLAAKKAHDCLNAVGFKVKNRAGAQWLMKGDGHMTAATQEQAQRAVDESKRQVEAGAFDADAIEQYMPWMGQLEAQAIKDYYNGDSRPGVRFDPDKERALFDLVDQASTQWFDLIDASGETVSPMMRDLCHAIMEMEFTAHPEEYDDELADARAAREANSMTNTGLNISMLRDFLKHALPTMVPAAYASTSAADLSSETLELYRPRDPSGKVLPTGANDFVWDGSTVTFKINVSDCEPGDYTLGLQVHDQDSGLDYLPSGQFESSPAGTNEDEVYGTFRHQVTVPAGGGDAHQNGNQYIETTFTLSGDSDHGEHYVMVYADASCTMVIGRSDARDSEKTSNPVAPDRAPVVPCCRPTQKPHSKYPWLGKILERGHQHP